MDPNLPSDDGSTESHVIVRYDPSYTDSELFLSFRTVDGKPILVATFGPRIPKNSALMQMRAMSGAPYYDGETDPPYPEPKRFSNSGA